MAPGCLWSSPCVIPPTHPRLPLTPLHALVGLPAVNLPTLQWPAPAVAQLRRWVCYIHELVAIPALRPYHIVIGALIVILISPFSLLHWWNTLRQTLAAPPVPAWNLQALTAPIYAPQAGPSFTVLSIHLRVCLIQALALTLFSLS